ncbi:MAG: ECF transporter S component, partial [Anaerolineae bacterium]
MRREASPGRRLRPVLSPLILLLATLLGIIAFLFPFFIPAAAHSGPRSAAHAADAPVIFVLLLLLCLVALVG